MVAKRTQLTLIYLISLYTRQNQGRVSCSLYSGNIVVYISHIVESYNATCVYDYHSCWSVGIHFFLSVKQFCQAVFPCRSLPLRIFLNLFFPLFLLLAIMCFNMISRKILFTVMYKTLKCVLFPIWFCCLMHDYEVFLMAFFLITVAPKFFL